MRHGRKEYLVCYIGGGSGGHLFPLFAVEKAVRSLCDDRKIPLRRYLITGRSKKERDWVGGTDIPFRQVHSGKLRRYASLRNLFDLFLVALGFFESFFILLFDRPDIIFSKGGYVSVAPVLAARLLFIPVVIHESDATLGLANRICSRSAAVLCLTHAETLETLPDRLRKRAVVTGVPSRDEWGDTSEADIHDALSLSRQRPIVTFLGGSQGALRINETLESILDELLLSVQVVHQTGKGKSFRESEDGYVSLEFITDAYMPLLRSSACVVSRAGASALADFVSAGVPMILIPLPLSASRGDQIENARLYENRGTAIVLDNDTLSAGTLLSEILSLVKDTPRADLMRKKLESSRLPLPSRSIAKIIVDGIGKKMLR